MTGASLIAAESAFNGGIPRFPSPPGYRRWDPDCCLATIGALIEWNNAPYHLLRNMTASSIEKPADWSLLLCRKQCGAGTVSDRKG